MRFQGRITAWRDDRGFGFITPDGGGEHVFVHIRNFPRGGRRPAQDDRVNYTAERDERGRLRAASAAHVVTTKSPSSSFRHGRRPGLLAVAVAFLLLVPALVALGRLPAAIAVVYVVMSIVTFGAYALDKEAARADRWRTPESTLHMLGLFGGWPGALLAQQLLRHKSKKASFIAAFWFSAAVNASVLLWMLTPSGSEFLTSLTSGR